MRTIPCLPVLLVAIGCCCASPGLFAASTTANPVNLGLVSLVASATDPAEFQRAPFAEGETPEYAPVHIGEWGRTTFLTFGPRYISTTNNRFGRDSYVKRFLTGMSWLNIRWEEDFLYRRSEEGFFRLRPTAALGWAYNSVAGHDDFTLQNTNQRVLNRATIRHETILTDIGIQAGIGSGQWETFLDYRSMFAFRDSRVTAASSTYNDAQSGFIDNFAKREREVVEDLTWHRAGIGVAYNSFKEPWNYRLSMQYYPWAQIRWEGDHATTWGLGLQLQANGWRLRDDTGLALYFKWDWLNSDNGLSGNQWFEVGIGVRFS